MEKNIRVLAPDLLEAFPDSESVNQALRAVAAVAVLAVQNRHEAISAKRVTAPARKKKARP